MSVCRKLPDGTIQKIAGHTILLDANASEVRTGTFNVTGGPAGWVTQTITFSDPMPDTDYVVVLECNSQDWGGGDNSPGPFRIGNKTTTGFTVSQYNTTGAKGFTFSGTYTAWKPVKIEGYTELQNKINNPDETPTIDSMNLVTSDGVARAIENASAVWKGTKAEWNALPAADKVKYDLAVLLDQTLVKAVDRETGDETDVADLSGQFVGTHAEWEAESNKTQYKTALLTDERTTVNEVLSTGALNEVADNARIWRGTKEEWDALSAAEKDEWDQAEIETIEAQGLNPFRTLSDPESISIALNTDYTCPHDGFIVVKGARNSNFTIIINGVTFFDTYTVENDENGILVPVQQGDVMRITAESTPQVRARWYTTDINPGNPIDYPVIHRSQSLDWDNKVNVPITEFSAGYSAPFDGFMLVRYGSTYGFAILVNDQTIFENGTTGSYIGNISFPVSKDDVVKFTGSTPVTDVFFVPYKDYPDYSTTEHWTGKRWIDGKKIYSKVLHSDGPNTSFSWTVSGIDTVINMSGTYNESDNSKTMALPESGGWSPSGAKYLGVSTAYTIATGTFDVTSTVNNLTNVNLIVEYTKVGD